MAKGKNPYGKKRIGKRARRLNRVLADQRAVAENKISRLLDGVEATLTGHTIDLTGLSLEELVRLFRGDR